MAPSLVWLTLSPSFLVSCLFRPPQDPYDPAFVAEQKRLRAEIDFERPYARVRPRNWDYITGLPVPKIVQIEDVSGKRKGGRDGGRGGGGASNPRSRKQYSSLPSLAPSLPPSVPPVVLSYPRSKQMI
jgi:hypothetical protein